METEPVDGRRPERELGTQAVSGGGGSLIVKAVGAGLAFLLYVLLFPLLYRWLGSTAPTISALGVMLAGGLLGSRWGAAAGLACLPMNLLLLRAVGERTLGLPGHLAATAVFVVMGAVVGRLRELTILVRRNHGELRGVLSRVRDAQRALAEREAQLSQAQALAHLGYWVLDLETWKATWSAELYDILGEDPATFPVSVEAWWGHIHPEDREVLKTRGARGIEEDVPVQDEFRVVRGDGKTRWVFGRAQALRNEVGKPVKLLGTVQDLTEHRELQSQLAAAERLATVGTLAAGVAHEINNPLASVISNLEFVLESLRRQAVAAGSRPTELVAAAGEALEGADRVSRIVRDLTAFARPKGRAGPVDVERVLDLSVSMASTQTRYRARIVKEYGHVPSAQGEAAQLGQVFLNLLVNAAQAIPAGHPEQHEIRLTTRVEGERIAVSIADTGSGMAPEVRRRIFEPFFTTRPIGAGMGLGLSTSLAIARSLGGDIGVESEPGKGSVFTVTLPMPAAGRAPAPSFTPPPSAARRGRVLIVDGDPAAKALAEALAGEHDVRCVPDGQAALEEIAARGRFDAVFCNLGACGPKGTEVHEPLLQRDPDLASRMVFLIDDGITSEHRAFLASTSNRVLAKPLAVEALQAFLREELSRR